MIAPGGPAYADVVAAFGRGILGRGRQPSTARPWGPASSRTRRRRAELNALVHPRVRDEEERRAAAPRRAPGARLVTDAALLVEAGLHLRFDRLVVVDCEAGEQLRRLVARDGIDEAAARARIEAQMPAAEKRRFAHVVLDASGTLEETDAAAARLAAELAALAETSSPRPSLREAAVVAALASGPAHGPRGLDPARWATEVGAAGGVEMERLKRALVPPAAVARGTWPQSRFPIRGPVRRRWPWWSGLWSLGRRGLDAEFTAAVMFSTAYLTDRHAARAAAACLLAIAAAQLAGGAAAGEAALAVVDGHRRAVGGRRRCPDPRTRPSTRRCAISRTSARAAEEARAAGGDPRLAAGLVAAAAAQASPGGRRDPPGPSDLIEAARALVRGTAPTASSG